MCSVPVSEENSELEGDNDVILHSTNLARERYSLLAKRVACIFELICVMVLLYMFNIGVQCEGLGLVLMVSIRGLESGLHEYTAICSRRRITNS